MTDLTSAYNYRKAVLGKLAAPSSMAATPDLGEITQARSAAVAQTKAQDEKLARDATYGEKALSEKNREFDAQLDLDRQRLDNWAEQNKWATGIAVANLGITGLSIPAAIKTADRQEATLKGIVAAREGQVAATVKGNEDTSAAIKKQGEDQAAWRTAQAAKADAAAAESARLTGELNARLEYAQALEDARSQVGTEEATAGINDVQKKTQQGTAAINAYDRSLSDVARRRTLQ